MQHNCVQRAVKPEFSYGKIKKKQIGFSDINNACGHKRILPDLEKYSTKERTMYYLDQTWVIAEHTKGKVGKTER